MALCRNSAIRESARCCFSAQLGGISGNGVGKVAVHVPFIPCCLFVNGAGLVLRWHCFSLFSPHRLYCFLRVAQRKRGWISMGGQTVIRYYPLWFSFVSVVGLEIQYRLLLFPFQPPTLYIEDITDGVGLSMDPQPDFPIQSPPYYMLQYRCAVPRQHLCPTRGAACCLGLLVSLTSIRMCRVLCVLQCCGSWVIGQFQLLSYYHFSFISLYVNSFSFRAFVGETVPSPQFGDNRKLLFPQQNFIW